MDDKPVSGSDFRRRLRKPFGYLAVAVLASLVSVLIYAGAQYLYLMRNPSGKAAQNSGVLENPASAQLGPEAGLLKKTSESFRMVAKKVGPAVVNIKSTKAAPKTRASRGGARRRGGPQAPDDDGGGGRDPFFDFFERFGAPFPFQQPETPQTSLGSGILLDKLGHIVTNNHVVEDSSEILVMLANDKTEIKAKVVGTDPKTDLAVLKLELAKDLPNPAEFADSDTVEVGDWAIAIGSPFALGQSVTVGIVSAKGGRNSLALTGAEFSGDLIQTDAAINPGNSGGPLCDLDGKVMGVNTAIYTRSGGYMGIGFAIPSNVVKEVSGKLMKDGKIVRGWMGVFIQALDPELAKELGLKDGVGIHEVIEESPAATAGLKAGDVIIEVDGKAVKEVTELQKVISNYKPGQVVKIKVVSYTDKKTRSVTVKIGELPAEEPASKGSPKESDEPDRLGLLLSATKNKQGVQVDAIQPGSVAEQVGLEVGDIIVRVNRKPVDTLPAYQKQIAASKRIYLEVKRKGRTLFYQFVAPE